MHAILMHIHSFTQLFEDIDDKNIITYSFSRLNINIKGRLLIPPPQELKQVNLNKYVVEISPSAK